MTLTASGEQAAGNQLRVRVQRGGYPGTVTVINQEEGDTDWYGWNVPAVPHCYRVVSQASTPGVRGLRWPSAAVSSSGAVVVSYCDNNGTTSSVKYITRATDGTWGTPGTIDSEAFSGSLERLSRAVALPDGRVLVFYLSYDASNNLAQISAQVTDDDGATWALWAENILAEPIDTSTDTPTRLVAAFSPIGGGQISLILFYNDGADKRYQYASSDMGLNLTFIEGATVAAYDVIGTDAGFVAVSNVAARYGSAFTPISTVGTSSTGVGSGLDYTGFAEDSGVLWVLTSGTTSYASRSTDNGTTWQITDDGSVTTFWWRTPGSAYPARLSAVWHEGSALVLHNAESTTGTYDNSLWETRLGGFSNVTMPPLSFHSGDINQSGFSRTWVGFDLPGVDGWTASGTAASETIDSSGRLVVTTADGVERKYTLATTNTDGDRGYTCRFTASVTDGNFGVRLIIDDGGIDCDVSILLTSTTLEAYDNQPSGEPGTTIGTDVTGLTGGTEYQVLIGFSNAGLSAWYRPWDASSQQTWTSWLDGETVTDGPDNLTEQVQWGRIDLSGAGTFTGTSAWKCREFLLEGLGNLGPITLAPGQSNPNDIRGRPLTGSPSYIDGGTYVAASGGPAPRGDTWNIDTEYEYPIDNLHVLSEPSPQTPHRTTGTTTPWRVAWQFTDTSDGTLESDIWAFFADGVPFRNIRFEYTDTVSPPAWTTIGTVDLGTAFAGSRGGTDVGPATTGSNVDGPYIEHDELVGGHVEFPNGDVRRIIRNTSGYLTSGSTIEETRCRIYLDPDQVDDGEDTSGTFYLRHPRVCVIMHRPFGGSVVAGVRVSVDPAGTEAATAEGYHQNGTWAFGPVAVLGMAYEDNRRQRWGHNTEIDEDRAGRRRSKRYGPPRLTREVAWPQGVDTTMTRGTNTGDDYIVGTSTSGARPIAMYREAPMLVQGIFSTIDANGGLLVDLPYIPAGTPDVVALTWQRARGALLCRFLGELPLETITGDEEVDEVIRINRVILEGEV